MDYDLRLNTSNYQSINVLGNIVVLVLICKPHSAYTVTVHCGRQTAPQYRVQQLSETSCRGRSSVVIYTLAARTHSDKHSNEKLIEKFSGNVFAIAIAEFPKWTERTSKSITHKFMAKFHDIEQYRLTEHCCRRRRHIPLLHCPCARPTHAIPSTVYALYYLPNMPAQSHTFDAHKL